MVTRYPCPSSRQPTDAAARPLPSEDTTPPVTKMYLVCRPSISPSTGSRRRQQTAHLFKILGRIHTERVVRRLDGFDPDAVFERAQLFQRFGAFERRRFEARQHE